MINTEIHIVANSSVKYLEYAICCIFGLIRGKVPAENIVLWIDKALVDTFFYRQILLKIGINIRIFEKHFLKTQIYGVIRPLDYNKNVLRMDADILVHPDFDVRSFLERCEDSIIDKIAVGHQSFPRWDIVLEKRKFLRRKETGTLEENLNKFFSISEEDLINYLRERKKWIYGGVVFIPQPVIQKFDIFNKLGDFAEDGRCDELPLLAFDTKHVKDNNSSIFTPLLDLNHLISPRMPQTAKYDFLHYEGGGYRIIHNGFISSCCDEAISSFFEMSKSFSVE